MFQLWSMGLILLVSSLSAAAEKATYRLPDWLMAPIRVPGTIWHESCHAVACVLSGHRITEIQWVSRPNSIAHVNYAYNPHSLYQQAGTALVGWAPVLFSGALLTWGLPRTYDLVLWKQALIWYGVGIVSMAMPLSMADWKGATRYLLLLMILSSIGGSFWWHETMTWCQPWSVYSGAVTHFVAIQAAIWAVSMVFGARPENARFI